MPELATNVLYYGDNLDILRRYLPAASVDLVYLDPPFNSNCDDNVIFRDESGNRSDAQLLAVEDTWHWGPSAPRSASSSLSRSPPSRCCSRLPAPTSTRNLRTARTTPAFRSCRSATCSRSTGSRCLPLLLMPTNQQAERIPSKKAAEQGELFG